jgi:nicotinamidase-related amidase
MANAPDNGSEHGEYRDTVPRQEQLTIDNSALVVIDLTRFDAHPQGGMARVLMEQDVDFSYYWDRVEQVMMPNVLALIESYRERKGRLVFTRVGGQFDDYADSLVHLRELHRRAGSKRGSDEFEMRDEIQPRPGEAVVDKPGSSAFTTSNLDVLLRNAGVTHLVVVGVVTNCCVLLSALTAWDLGYSVTIVDDASAADGEDMHEAALSVARWLGIRILQTADVLEEIGSVQRQPEVV